MLPFSVVLYDGGQTDFRLFQTFAPLLHPFKGLGQVGKVLGCLAHKTSALDQQCLSGLDGVLAGDVGLLGPATGVLRCLQGLIQTGNLQLAGTAALHRSVDVLKKTNAFESTYFKRYLHNSCN